MDHWTRLTKTFTLNTISNYLFIFRQRTEKALKPFRTTLKRTESPFTHSRCTLPSKRERKFLASEPTDWFSHRQRRTALPVWISQKATWRNSHRQREAPFSFPNLSSSIVQLHFMGNFQMKCGPRYKKSRKAVVSAVKRVYGGGKN